AGFGEPWPEFNDGVYYRDRCAASDAGRMLIEFYAENHGSSAPFHGWLQRIHNKQITVDGNVVTDPHTVLKGVEELVYHRLPWKEPEAPHSIGILYEDDDMIALNKPSGLQVLPGGSFQQRTILTQLRRRTENRVSRCRATPVHRLGRGTSGVLLCAKTTRAKSHLAALFARETSVVETSRHNPAPKETRRITKLYRALVSGIILDDEVVIDQPIGVVEYPGVSHGLYVATPSGKPALSGVMILERNIRSNSTLVQV
ncbi:hypothetical protein M569_13411, partial [Genlisea aurea]